FITLRTSKGKALKFANFEAISRVSGVEVFSKNMVVLGLSILTVFLIVLSISGITLHMDLPATSFSFVIGIDNSRSMEANDVLPTRLELAKETASSFVDSVPFTTRIGIISFSGNSYIEQDLSADTKDTKKAISGIQRKNAEGTNMYELIITSSNLLIGEDSRAVILLSDGQINVGDLNLALEYANKNNVIIHTIAVGTPVGGETSFGISKTDEDALKAIAFNTGGEFFNASDRDTLRDSFDKILKITKRKVSIDLSYYVLAATIFILLIEYLLMNTRYRIFP
ncbi:MAG: VWA domain-containing protein, partial [archaeon]